MVIQSNNKVTVRGIIRKIKFAYRNKQEVFNYYILEVPRDSGVQDILPVVISELLLNPEENHIGECITVDGQYRSRNYQENGKSHMELYIFAQTVANHGMYVPKKKINRILIQGFLCKPPVFRTTGTGKNITDIMVVANRPSSDKDYIPCIAWNRNALYAAELRVGDEIVAEGRIQSRRYTKYINDNESISGVAYEASLSGIERLG